MKKLILFIAAALCASACSTLTSAERAERDARTEQSVADALTGQHYRVDIHMMYPRRGKAMNVTPDYFLQVKGDTLVSYLPYIGRAYNVPYGGGKGLNFTAPIKDYQAAKDGKSNTRILIRVDSDEDIVTYQLNVFPNGNTSVDVSARNRESISYSGEVEAK